MFSEIIEITITDSEIINCPFVHGSANLMLLIAISKGLKCSGVTNPIPIGKVTSSIDFEKKTTYIRQEIQLEQS